MNWKRIFLYQLIGIRLSNIQIFSSAQSVSPDNPVPQFGLMSTRQANDRCSSWCCCTISWVWTSPSPLCVLTSNLEWKIIMLPMIYWRKQFRMWNPLLSELILMITSKGHTIRIMLLFLLLYSLTMHIEGIGTDEAIVENTDGNILENHLLLVLSSIRFDALQI